MGEDKQMMTETTRNTADTADEHADAIRTMGELADHLGGLPEPTGRPDVQFLHPGKEYESVTTATEFTLTGYYPDGPAGGVLEFEVSEGVAFSEHTHDSGGVSASALEGYEPEETDRGVITVNYLMAQIREFQIAEGDAYSYADAYWNHVDSEGDADE